MPIFSAFVVYANVWFLTLFVVLPLREKTQGEAGAVVPGTSSSAPANLNMRRKLAITTIAATPIWAVIVAIIVSGAISIEDIDLFQRLTSR